MTKYVVSLGSIEAADAERFGPKAANQAALGQAGLPIPSGFCIGAEAYRAQLTSAGLEEAMAGMESDDLTLMRKSASDIRIALFKSPIAGAVEGEILAARQKLIDDTGALVVVRSSALVEDRDGTSFAGQFESFLGLESETDFLTAVRACWAALWSIRALRYMAVHDINPASTAMALLVQPLIAAQSSGGGLSQTADGGMLLSATWGLGEAIAQGEVVPDRYDLSADGALCHVHAGRKTHAVGCAHHHDFNTRAVERERAAEPCLSEAEAVELGGLLRRAEVVNGMAAEIEWAKDETGFKLLQVRPLQVSEPAAVADNDWSRHPRIKGHPAGVGWGTGRACVINCECELGRVAPGDVLVTTVAGPSLVHILPKVAAVVAELGGSTSHLASLARERQIPMVLGVLDATRAIPEGAQVAVDGVAGEVRWVEE